MLVILGYHKIGPASPEAPELRFSVPEDVFVDHLRTLGDAGWEVIGLPALLDGLGSPELLPSRAAMITFDDGYRSLYELALPRLVELGFPAVTFVPAGYVGSSMEWTAERYSDPPERICGWEELRELQARGISVQSHAVSHRPFSELTPAQIEEELVQSRAVLEDGLETPVDVISFPFGDRGRDAAQTRAALERSGYRAAFGNQGGAMRLPPEDTYGLNRLMVFTDTDLAAALEL